MRSKRNIRLALSISMIIALALIIPGLSIAGSLEPPSYAVDGSGNPIPTMQPKTACRGEFYDNSDGTVTDCKTGLIWMQNANCVILRPWSDALASCSSLTGGGNCGLYDGSSAGDWHLPTIEELKTLPNRNYSNPALSNGKGDVQWSPGNAFNNVPSAPYWSSTTYAEDPTRAWIVNFSNGTAFPGGKDSSNFVWCVRAGQ